MQFSIFGIFDQFGENGSAGESLQNFADLVVEAEQWVIEPACSVWLREAALLAFSASPLLDLHFLLLV